MSIYREEAIDSLISCIRNTDFPAAQISAAQTIMSLQGRFTMSGKSLTRNFLLKCAGLDKPYNNLMRLDQLGNFTEEVKQTLVSFLEYILCFSLVIFSLLFCFFPSIFFKQFF